MIVLSHYQTRPLQEAYLRGERSATTSPDLGITQVDIALDENGVAFTDGTFVSWDAISLISETTNQCYRIVDNVPISIQFFSSDTNWNRSLMATAGAPTTLVAGFPMHRIKDTDPYKDTRAKIAAISPLTGRVLDTTTGLGYTAIEAARTAEHVTTIELDSAAIEVARMNPWSRELFDNPRISLIIGDAYECIASFADGSFQRVLHDPPSFSLAGELYSEAFYRQIFRVLTPKGRLFHYIGDPDSSLGKRITAGVLRRLNAAGFGRVERYPAAYGVVAYKSR
jgi:uncharacterized protein